MHPAPVISFNRDYYENGARLGLSCYTNYRWLPDLTIPMAEAMIRHLKIKKTDSILDYGCAKGFAVKAFRSLGYNAHGIDISGYAVNAADAETRPFLREVADDPRSFPALNDGSPWDWVIAKDVMEHIEEDALHHVLAGLSFVAKKVFIVVPLGDGAKYVIPEMEKDVSHRIRRPLDWWVNELNEAGFAKVDACYSVLGIKDIWTASWPKGNGFLIAE